MRATTPLLMIFLLASFQPLFGQAAELSDQNVFPLFIEIQPDKPAKLSSLKIGDVVEGTLARDVYSAVGKVFTAGSHIYLTTDHLERQRKEVNDRWPWVVRVFARRHENVPIFNGANVLTPDGYEHLLGVDSVSIGIRDETRLPPNKAQGEHREKTGKGRKDRSFHYQGRISRPLIFVEAHGESKGFLSTSASLHTVSTRLVTLPSGTDCRVLLLNGLSASKNNRGDVVEARLLEPVLQGQEVVLPAGSVFEGEVLRAKRPQSLSRAGSLAITFNRLILPEGAWFPLSASISGIDLTRGSHTKIDAEGGLRGERPGFVWALINGGVSAGIAKEVDDGTQLVVEALLAGATDASTAGTARLAGAVVSAAFMLTRHGRDVILPNFTDMDITLNRPLTLSIRVTSDLGSARSVKDTGRLSLH